MRLLQQAQAYQRDMLEALRQACKYEEHEVPWQESSCFPMQQVMDSNWSTLEDQTLSLSKRTIRVIAQVYEPVQK